uniref:Mutator-like transposase domain-containing protein n=1 Tax=Cuerna arida TaxID=1464854 RepID=A0A1B6FPA7_9HEMI
MKHLGNHGPLGCSFQNMVFMRERRVGLKSCFIFNCNFCNIEQSLWSKLEKKEEMDVNTSAVSGTITTGGGHYQLEELLSTMNIPPMSNTTFSKYEEIIHKGLTETASQEMKKAAEEEAHHAEEIGEVDKDGTPLITLLSSQMAAGVSGRTGQITHPCLEW